jgi:AraC-like DNA-binding protein
MAKVRKIAARVAGKVVTDLARRGVAADDLLKQVGLHGRDIADPEARISYAAVVGLMERAASVLGDASYGLRLGAAQEVRESGLLGFVVLNSPTLMDALRNLQRYLHVGGDGEEFAIDVSAAEVAVRFREADPALRGLRHNSEYFAALIVRACRDMTRRTVSPLRAEFMHAPPNARVAYEDVLGCPARFHAEWDALVFRAETLRLPVVGADDRLLVVLQAACERILGPRPEKRDLVHDVRELILDGLTKGRLQAESVAAALNMSGKTLERRLGERGTSFGDLLGTIRCELAQRYLVDTDFRLEQVAYLTGYSEPAALVRAFKRWTGMTPIAYRQERRPQVAGT